MLYTPEWVGKSAFYTSKKRDVISQGKGPFPALQKFKKKFTQAEDTLSLIYQFILEITYDILT